MLENLVNIAEAWHDFCTKTPSIFTFDVKYYVNTNNAANLCQCMRSSEEKKVHALVETILNKFAWQFNHQPAWAWETLTSIPSSLGSM